MIIFEGNDIFAFRDPAAIFENGICHLFFTVSEKADGYMYNRIAHSTSRDLKTFSSPKFITKRDNTLNFCSPGNIIPYHGGYLICLCSYPMPMPFRERSYAEDSARLYTIYSPDLIHFEEPTILNPRSDTPVGAVGRMIDPFILPHNGKYYIFYKQNGISMSSSDDFVTWRYCGRAQGGENACVIKTEDGYYLLHSPENGIGIMKSNDMIHWESFSHTTLEQDHWKWAEDRLTAAFATELPSGFAHKYAVFFHGSKKVFPETHGNATLALAFTDDFLHFEY